MKWWVVFSMALLTALAAGCSSPQPPLEEPSPPPSQPSVESTAPVAPLESPQPSADQPTPAPTVPLQVAPAKPAGQQSPVYDLDAVIVEMEPGSGRMGLAVTGSLPTPCHKLQSFISPPDANSRIDVTLYSVSDPEKVCAQVLAPFAEKIPLGEIPAGSYTVYVNGSLAGELQLPE